MSATLLSPFFVLPNDGVANSIRSAIHTFKITAKETAGAFSVMEASLDPGLLVPPHQHTREDELFYILEGEAGFRIGDQEFQAPSGSYVFAPRGIPHAVWTPGTRTHKVMGVIMPGGAERYFEEMATAVNQPGVPDAAQIIAIHNRHGMTSVMEWVPELTAKYHLKLLGQP
jgi:quercetin dioxygenase-like cupin family protein